MKIGLAQIDIVSGEPDKNVSKMLEYISMAKEQQLDIVCFPEMSVGGYLLGDLWLDDEYCRYLMSFNNIIQEASEGIMIIYGNVYLDERETIKDMAGKEVRNFHFDGRKRRYNCAYVFNNKKPGKVFDKIRLNDEVFPEGVVFKTLLPNYRFFDDKRYFASPLDLVKDNILNINHIYVPFILERIKGVVYTSYYVGVELCEDLWNKDYNINPTKYLKRISDVIINISASPWTYGKNDTRDRRVKESLYEVSYDAPPFLYINCIGAQNNGKNVITFDGGTTVYGGDGFPRIFAKEMYKEELLICDSNKLPKDPIERKNEPLIVEKYKAIKRGIQFITDITKINKFVVGLSGGIDSSLVAALLVDVVGKDKVFGFNMPSRYNSKKTKDVAKKIAENLGIGYYILPIEDILHVNQELLADFFICNRSLVEENMQAKIRGTSILSNLAQMLNALMTNNGNKLEVFLGYATLYGDWNGAISPIGDLLKTEVYEMAKYMNIVFGKEIIPLELFPDDMYCFTKDQIQPSAELKEGQLDPIKLGYHDSLVFHLLNYQKVNINEIIRWYRDGVLHTKLGISLELMYRYGVETPQVFIDDLKWFFKQFRLSVFKRVQSPPIIITSKTAFGYDLRESILPYNEKEVDDALCRQVLFMKRYLS